MQLRKVVQYVRLRFVPFLVSGVILVSPLSLCANAAVWEGNASIGYTYWGGNGVAYMHSQDIVLPSSGVALQETVNQRTSNGMRLALGDVAWTKPLTIYISGFYFNTHSAATIAQVGDPMHPSNYEIKFRDTSRDVTGALDIDKISSFTPNYDAAYVGRGLSLVASLDASEDEPVADVLVRPHTECGWKRTGANSYQGFWYWTSVRVISAETSAELDELNNIAQQIVAGNETLEAMLGDVVGLLQQIYAITGDIEIAADRTVDLLNTLLEYVDGVEGQLGNIYSTLSSFTAQLISLLQSNNQALIQQIQQSTGELTEILNEIRDLIWESDGGRENDAADKVEQGSAVQEGLGELQRPDYEDIDTNVGDYVDQFDGGSGESDAALSGFLGRIFESSMVTSMLMISLTFCMVAYVLYGKR